MVINIPVANEVFFVGSFVINEEVFGNVAVRVVKTVVRSVADFLWLAELVIIANKLAKVFELDELSDKEDYTVVRAVSYTIFITEVAVDFFSVVYRSLVTIINFVRIIEENISIGFIVMIVLSAAVVVIGLDLIWVLKIASNLLDSNSQNADLFGMVAVDSWVVVSDKGEVNNIKEAILAAPVDVNSFNVVIICLATD